MSIPIYEEGAIATTGQVLDNPCTGQRVIFRQLAADTGGQSLDASVHLLEMAVWPAQQGKVDRHCNPSLLQSAVIGQYALPYVYVTQPPLIVQRMGLVLLAPLARLLGYRLPEDPATGAGRHRTA